MAPRKTFLSLTAFFYQHLAKPVFFLFDAEKVHVSLVSFGQNLAHLPPVKGLFSQLFATSYPALSQTLHGITFCSPVGLAAGFDYEARLTQILPYLGFGFGTVGTFSALPYEGNPYPRLGRLPKSRSLLVNKGFKNFGVKKLVKSLSHLTFTYPVGISLGKSNRPEVDTLPQALKDITLSFMALSSSNIPFSYYELNISCPNLNSHVSFYEPSSLTKLLTALASLKLSKPVFIKMPICLTDKEFVSLLDIIVKFRFVKGIIVGNLQTNRQHPSLIPSEVERFARGNFSGKPTFETSNHFIRLAYKKYSKQLTIIGCGGVFTAKDAYQKIRSGASLVQLITGMIYQGPQLIAQINQGLDDLLRRDGFKHISEAVGTSDI